MFAKSDVVGEALIYVCLCLTAYSGFDKHKLSPMQVGEALKSYLSVSHAAAYAAISMQTAYLKANYPHEFAVGLLTSVMDDSDKLMKYVNTYRAKGINVLPPDVFHSKYGFSLEGNDIRFGLFAIKGVGTDVANTIPTEVAKEPYRNLEDFITRHISMNKTAFENLTKAGALDSFGYNRNTILNNLEQLIKKIKKSEKNKDENQISLFDFFGYDDLNENNIEIKEYPPLTELNRCKLEKEATGMYISGHPAAYIEDLAKRNGAIDIYDIKREDSIIQNRTEVFIGGVVTNITRKVTKNGNPMLIVDVEDTTGSISVLMFDKAIAKYSGQLKEDSIVFLNGSIRNSGEDASLILNNVCELKDTPVVLWAITKDASLTSFEKLAETFKKDNPGIGDYLYIASSTSRNAKAIGEISVTSEVIRKAKIWFGADSVMIKEKKVKNS